MRNTQQESTFCESNAALSLLTLCEFDTEDEFSGNSADKIIRAKTFHCQKIDLPSTPPPIVAPFLEIYKKNRIQSDIL